MSGAWNSRPSLAATWPAFMSMPIAVPSSSGCATATAWQTTAYQRPASRFSTAETGRASGYGVPPRRRTVIQPKPGRRSLPASSLTPETMEMLSKRRRPRNRGEPGFFARRKKPRKASSTQWHFF